MARLEAYSAFGDFANGAGARAHRHARRARADAVAGLPGSGGGDGDRHRRQARAALLVERRRSPSARCSSAARPGYHGTHGFGTGARRASPPTARASAPQVDTDPGRPRLARGARGRDRARRRRAGRRLLRRAGDRRRRRLPAAARATSRASPRCASAHGVLLVVDSVICGFGRLGNWFGIERWNVEARHDRVRQGRHQRLPPARRRDRLRAGRRAVLARAWRVRSSARARPTPAMRRAARRPLPTSRSSSMTDCSNAVVSSSARSTRR